jgi:hypothetical protein
MSNVKLAVVIILDALTTDLIYKEESLNKAIFVQITSYGPYIMCNNNKNYTTPCIKLISFMKTFHVNKGSAYERLYLVGRLLYCTPKT